MTSLRSRRIGLALLLILGAQTSQAPPAYRVIPERPIERRYVDPRPEPNPPPSDHPVSAPDPPPKIRVSETKEFDVPGPHKSNDRAREDGEASPFLFCAIPKGASFESTFQERYTSFKASEMNLTETTARRILTTKPYISHDFKREELSRVIMENRARRPFILVCHTTGSRENREIPLGDAPGETISENEARAICSENDSELLLVSCYSSDLGIGQEITYAEALRITHLALDRWAASSKRSITDLTKAFKEVAGHELQPGFTLRISFGAGAKTVIIVAAFLKDDEGFPWFRTVVGAGCLCLVTRWTYRKVKAKRSVTEGDFQDLQDLFAALWPTFEFPQHSGCNKNLRPILSDLGERIQRRISTSSEAPAILCLQRTLAFVQEAKSKNEAGDAVSTTYWLTAARESLKPEKLYTPIYKEPTFFVAADGTVTPDHLLRPSEGSSADIHL
jgi:hypothetical protein